MRRGCEGVVRTYVIQSEQRTDKKTKRIDVPWQSRGCLFSCRVVMIHTDRDAVPQSLEAYSSNVLILLNVEQGCQQ